MYFLMVFVEMFIPSHFSSAVLWKGEDIAQALFKSNLIESDQHIEEYLKNLFRRIIKFIQIIYVEIIDIKLNSLLKVSKKSF